MDKCLASCRVDRLVYVSKVVVSPEAAVAMADALRENAALQCLCLLSCSFEGSTTAIVADALASRKRLERVIVSACHGFEVRVCDSRNQLFWTQSLLSMLVFLLFFFFFFFFFILF